VKTWQVTISQIVQSGNSNSYCDLITDAQPSSFAHLSWHQMPFKRVGFPVKFLRSFSGL